MSELGQQTRVVILGCGPAGAACALRLKRLASIADRPIRIIALEGKEFSNERHLNQCIGVLSPPLPALLEQQLGIPFPSHLSRTTITGYVVHGLHNSIELEDTESSIALRRVQFDAYMLDCVRAAGIEVLSARAVDIEFMPSSVVVYTENAPLEADVVVGAFGMDEGSAAMLGRASRYRPPQSLYSVVTKYHPGPEVMDNFGTKIHAFLPSSSRIEFAGITPKGNHLAINIAGRTVDSELMRSFLSHPFPKQLLGHLDVTGKLDSRDGRFYRGRFPCSPARRYYGDRYVVVGDAAGLVRPFKGKGVTSAVLSGIRAAETITNVGVSEQAFHTGYRQANQDITSDFLYGRLARILAIGLARFGLMDPVLRAALSSSDLNEALFGAVSAHAPYKEVFARSVRPRALLAVAKALLH